MLAHLSHQAKNPNYRFKRLFRNLYNPLFYELFLTSSDGDIRKQLPFFIAKLQAGSYLSKAGHGRKRLDRIVSQIVELILSTIYIEKKHELLSPQLFSNSFSQSTWLFSAKIERRGLRFLQAKISDRKFLALIQKLDALGYLRSLLLKIACLEIDRKVAQYFPDLAYVRVKDSLLVGVNSSKQAAQANQVAFVKRVGAVGFCLKINGKRIYHRQERIPFCQYELRFVSAAKAPLFYIKEANVIRQLQRYRIVRVEKDGELIAIHRPYLLNLNERDIRAVYKRNFREFVNEYRYATNRHLLNRCYRYMRESMLKTLAYKYKTTVKKVAKSLRNSDLERR